MVDISKLNKFSQLMHGLFCKAYPQWKGLMQNDELDTETLTIRIPSKFNGELALEIFTYDEEITVSFGNFHDHFGWGDVPDEEAFKLAKSEVDKILNDEILIAEYLKDGKVFQAETAYLHELEKYAASKHQLRVYGWSKLYLDKT